jgi:hypothetical protein
VGGFIASLLVKRTHVIAGRIVSGKIEQVGKIAQVRLVQEFILALALPGQPAGRCIGNPTGDSLSAQ